jgi:hypothetical protein
MNYGQEKPHRNGMATTTSKATKKPIKAMSSRAIVYDGKAARRHH